MITLKPITKTEIFAMIGKALFIKKKRQYKLIKNRLILKELANFTSKLTAKLLIFVTQNFQDTFESRKLLFINDFSISITVPSNVGGFCDIDWSYPK